MNERLIQALIRWAIIGVTALLGALIAATPVILDAVDDPFMRQIVQAAVIGLLSAIGKWVGGVTLPAPMPAAGRRAALPAGERRPNALAI